MSRHRSGRQWRMTTSAGEDLGRDMLAFAAERLMEPEVEAATGVPGGMRSAARPMQRNGCRERAWETRGHLKNPLPERFGVILSLLQALEGGMADQRGFFDLDERHAALSKAGDPLERLSWVVDFELFRADLEAALKRSDRAKGGRPPVDEVLMFKVLVLQALHGLSDARTEFRILDRRSFGRFLGIDDGDRAPDETTIWRFREALTTAGAMDGLFARFDAHLRELGYLAIGGRIVDALIVAAPRQRMTDAERETVNGAIPDAWKDRPAKLRQKDRDARWTLERGRRSRVRAGRSWRRSRCRSSATRAIFPRTGATASSAAGR